MLWKSMSASNCLVNHVLQNIFYVQKKNKAVEQLEGESIFIFIMD